MRKVLLLLCAAVCASTMSFGQTTHHEGAISETFRFIPGDDGFYLLEGNNDVELRRLYNYVDNHITSIRNGHTKIHVNGYCSTYATAAENLASAKIRSNRVKSELIVHKGVKEADFVTRNHATSHEGHKSVVVVTINTQGEKVVAEKGCDNEALVHAHKEAMEKMSREVVALENRVKVLESAEPIVNEVRVVEIIESPDVHPAWTEPYAFALRTNFLYDAALLPTIGIEWRAAKWFGLKVDGSYSNWKFDGNRVHKMWVVSPELRFYVGQERRIYLGLGGNYSKANMSWRPVSKLFSVNHGYNGNFWNAGLVLGYQAPISRKLSLDFNFGFGRTQFKYDTYNLDANHTVAAAGQKKTVWGVTQAGVSLVWRMGRSNYNE